MGLFTKLGLEAGINRPQDTPDVIFLTASTKGLNTGGSEKGYAYTTKKPSPLVESLDHINSEIKDFAPLYKKLKENWYLYYEQGG